MSLSGAVFEAKYIMFIFQINVSLHCICFLVIAYALIFSALYKDCDLAMQVILKLYPDAESDATQDLRGQLYFVTLNVSSSILTVQSQPKSYFHILSQSRPWQTMLLTNFSERV